MVVQTTQLMVEVKMFLKTLKKITILTNLSYTTTTTTTGFGGACYNRCVGSYLSSYRSLVTSLLLFCLMEQLPGNGAKNVGQNVVLNNSPNI